MDKKWENSLFEIISGLFDDTVNVYTDDFGDKQGLVIEPLDNNEELAEDLTVTVEHLPGEITALEILATLYTNIDEKQAAEINKLLPYLNEYTSFGSFGMIYSSGYVFYNSAFAINEKMPTESFLRIFIQTFDTANNAAAEAKELLNAVIRGEKTADDVIAEGISIVQ